MDAINNASANESTLGPVPGPSYDEPYRFGRRPTTQAPFPFTPREFARLLIVRSRLEPRFGVAGR
jgi:hypothetical protein